MGDDEAQDSLRTPEPEAKRQKTRVSLRSHNKVDYKALQDPLVGMIDGDGNVLFEEEDPHDSDGQSGKAKHSVKAERINAVED